MSQLFLTPRRSVPRAPGHGTVIDELSIQGTNVLVRAEGHGPTVALVHGWQGHSGQFSKLRSALHAAGYTVLTFDMPAHGESPGRTTNIGAFVETLEQVANRMAPLHAVIAHSLGGTAAGIALSRALAVDGAVLVSPMISFDFALDEFSRFLRLSPVARELAARATERRVGLRRDEVDLLRLAAPRCPIQLVHDRSDLRTPYHFSDDLARHWKPEEFLSTDGLGHKRILEDDQVIRSVLSFVKKLERRPSDALELTFNAAPTLRY